MYESPESRLRIRCEPSLPEPGGEDVQNGERVASWMVTLRVGCRSLREAVEPLGLWPACAPDERAPEGSGLLCRPLKEASTGATYSLTATVRDGHIVQITAFDEPPEWDATMERE